MNNLRSLQATGWSSILLIFGAPADKKKFSARLLTAVTVLFLIFAGSPLADINTNIASADSNPYATAGTIVVNTNNEAATFTLTGPTTYTGNGTSWTQTNASVGDYTITYGAIPEFDTPASEIQTLVSGGTITFTGTYTASVGTISVTTNKAEATFTLTGSANYTGNGTNWTQNNAPVGTYTITFDPIPGYDTPSSHDHTLESGGTITCTGLYNVSAGTISVTTNNDAATFTLTGHATYSGYGTSWTRNDAPIGTYTITFGDISGYDTPPGDTRTLVSEGTIAFTGTYGTIYTLTLQGTGDAYISERYDGRNYGDSRTMYVRSKPQENMRSLIKFDTSSIPPGSMIISATLKLDAKSIPKASRNYIINRALASWDELSVTWNSKPAVAPSPTSSASTPSSPGWMEWDVTSDIQAFVNGNPDYGWQISDANENSPTEYKTTFYTKESASAALRPMLVIQYAS